MKPNTVIKKFPHNWNDFGASALTEKGMDVYTDKIASRLPDGVFWCGDELIAEVGYEWPEDVPDLETIISEAASWMMAEADDDCWE